MKNRFQRFIKDLSGPGPIFLMKYVLPPLFIFFIWGLISSIIKLNQEISDLKKTTGVVEDIFNQREIKGRGNVYYPLYIKLYETENLFRIKDSYGAVHGELKSKISKGDTVHLYTLYENESKILWGATYDVFQIEKSTVLFSINKVTEKQYEQIYWNIAFLLLTPITYIFIKKKYPNS